MRRGSQHRDPRVGPRVAQSFPCEFSELERTTGQLSAAEVVAWNRGRLERRFDYEHRAAPVTPILPLFHAGEAENRFLAVLSGRAA